ncbi:anaerobic sulfite reductase subunit AsrB [Garciella nitratireducens]|uniref:anaerobic sulfite reductase subunit AsrB n=1 Tax=Garciella nitratireducens TaxID=218205 RepID=UPI000DF8C30F|nr:anaerobic sulfite reductase subunit AsrB [Garciella nitratireducens]RBP44929.1 anaerobic sulfite reductase subunit B [Garciella nitratireducens]
MNNPVKPKARKILEVIPQTTNEYTFRLENNIPIKHGQFMQLSLPKIGEVPISVSDFGDGYVDFTIRRVGKVTDKLFHLQKGDQIFIRGCYGNGWPIEKIKEKNIVIIAGGTGVSPVKSLINALYNDPNYAKEVYLIIGYKDCKSILFKEDLKKWKLARHFHTIYTLNNAEYKDWNKGMITEFIKEIPFHSFDKNYECFVVGPPIMMKFVGEELLNNNVSEENIWMSFERKMSCAIGKCGHCRIDEIYVCLDGPVFNYTIAKKLVD